MGEVEKSGEKIGITFQITFIGLLSRYNYHRRPKNYSNNRSVGYDRVEQVWEGISEDGVEGNVLKGGLPS